jgi:hypothetical protein
MAHLIERLLDRSVQCFNNISCHGFEFAMSYRALPSFVNDLLRCYIPCSTIQKCMIKAVKNIENVTQGQWHVQMLVTHP